MALFGVVTLYAAFDRWAERRSHGTPLAKTIPTLLTLALLYELFPLDHFSVLLPLVAILLALLADWSRFHSIALPVMPSIAPEADNTENQCPVEEERADHV